MINSDLREKIINYFWGELENWDYDSWISSSSGDKEEMVKEVILELELPSELEEGVYELFYDWSDGLEEDSFMD